jgi:curved DNA-binding protein CbpA
MTRVAGETFAGPCIREADIPGMTTDFDLYAALGVGPDASPDEIRGAYRRAARDSHPDLHPGDATAAERFKRVQIAYEVLGDPQRRAAYDMAVDAPAPVAPYSPSAHRDHRVPPQGDLPVSLARELGETVRAIRVMARRSGFRRRVNRLIRYLERL